MILFKLRLDVTIEKLTSDKNGTFISAEVPFVPQTTKVNIKVEVP